MKHLVSLFDTTGLAGERFFLAGWRVTIIDILNVGERTANSYASMVLDWDILQNEQRIIDLKPDLLFGFPPCTDLTVAGARHFGEKAWFNPEFQNEAVHLARSVERIGEAADCDWLAENPVGRLSTLWRKPDMIFDPCDYGGWLPEDDFHPLWPSYIIPRDAYTKKTCFWLSKNFKRPEKKPVAPVSFEDIQGNKFSKQTAKLGGKSLKTKMIRSATPRGVFAAIADKYINEERR